MTQKQEEMDNIMNDIVSKVRQNDPHLDETLIILCSDHGMNGVSLSFSSPIFICFFSKVTTVAARQMK